VLINVTLDADAHAARRGRRPGFHCPSDDGPKDSLSRCVQHVTSSDSIFSGPKPGCLAGLTSHPFMFVGVSRPPDSCRSKRMLSQSDHGQLARLGRSRSNWAPPRKARTSVKQVTNETKSSRLQDVITTSYHDSISYQKFTSMIAFSLPRRAHPSFNP
jgi:hypothetical protein